MSVVLIAFPGAPSVSSQAVDAEQELRRQLEMRIRGRGIIFGAHCTALCHN